MLAAKGAVDLAAIYARLRHLTQTAQRSSYSKQTSSLRVEFETFLASLPRPRSIFQPPLKMYLVFLVWKDLQGEIVVHVSDCVNASSQNASDCGCPK